MNKKRKLLVISSCILLIVTLLTGCGGATADKPASLGSGGDFSRWFGPEKKLSREDPGTYYFTLTKDITIRAEGVIAGQDVVIDLNGHTITGETNRAFAISGGGSLTLKNGTVQTAGAAADGGVIYMDGAKGLTLVDATLTNTDDTQIGERLSGGVIYATAPAEGEGTAIRLYGDSCINGSPSGFRRNGGAATMMGNVSFYLHSGTVQNGKAGTAGNLYLDGTGAIYLLGGTVTGGTAVRSSEITGFGGNISIQSLSRLYMYAGTVSNGTAETSGGNIFLSNTAAFNGEYGMYLYDGLITGGAAIEEGGNISTGGKHAVLHMYGGTVEQGDAVLGGNISLQNGGLDLWGGLITGKTDSTRISQGGNVYSTAATVRLYDGRVENGTAENSGGNFALYDSLVEIYGGTVADGICYNTAVNQGGANFYAGKASTVNMYGGVFTGGVANAAQEPEASSSGGNLMIGGTTRMQLFGGSIEGGTVHGKITRGGSIYVYGQGKGNDSVLHMYGGTVQNGLMENTMRGMCIGAYSETDGNDGHGTARIFAGEIIFTGAADDANRRMSLHGNKRKGQDLQIFDGTNYKGLYNNATVGPCPDATHNTKTGEVAASCLTHGYTEYTCGTCGVWCDITAEPTGHTVQTESVTTEEGVTYTHHSCTACDAAWNTDVDATEAAKQK